MIAILEGGDNGSSQSEDVVSDDDAEEHEEDDNDADGEDVVQTANNLRADGDSHGVDGNSTQTAVSPQSSLLVKFPPVPIIIPPLSPVIAGPGPSSAPLNISCISSLSAESAQDAVTPSTPLHRDSRLDLAASAALTSLGDDILEVWAAVTDGSKYLIASAVLAVMQRTQTVAASPLIRLLIRRGHTHVWMRKAITYKYTPASAPREVLGPTSAAVLVWSACAVEVGFQFMSSLCGLVRRDWEGLFIDGMPPPASDELAEVIVASVLANIDTLPRILRGMLHVTNSTLLRKYPQFGFTPGGLLLFEYFVIPALR
jgi:hypothetical protein